MAQDEAVQQAQIFAVPEPEVPSVENSIKVVGIGGGGGNVVSHCASAGAKGVELIALNTDKQALNGLNPKINRKMIGVQTTRGEGAGGIPDGGRRAAEESRRELEDLLEDTRLLFIVACMGGGTGTGAAPFLAEIARERNILTVGVVTRPFLHERRDEIADEGIEQLRESVSALMVIPNEDNFGEDALLLSAYEEINEMLVCVIKSITDLLYMRGFINLDFADLNKVLTSEDGSAMDLFVGTGVASGENRAQEATADALDVSRFDISDSHVSPTSAILCFICNQDTDKNLGITRKEWDIVTAGVRARMVDKATLVFGMISDKNLEEGLLKVSVILPGQSNVGPSAKMVVDEGERIFENIQTDQLEGSPTSQPLNGSQLEVTATPQFERADESEKADIPALFKQQVS